QHTRSKRDWSSDVCSSDLASCSAWLHSSNPGTNTSPTSMLTQLLSSADSSPGREENTKIKTMHAISRTRNIFFLRIIFPYGSPPREECQSAPRPTFHSQSPEPPW